MRRRRSASRRAGASRRPRRRPTTRDDAAPHREDPAPRPARLRGGPLVPESASGTFDTKTPTTTADGNGSLLEERGTEDERLGNPVEDRAEHDRVCASGELVLAGHALPTMAASPVDRPVADVEGERAARRIPTRPRAKSVCEPLRARARTRRLRSTRPTRRPSPGRSNALPGRAKTRERGADPERAGRTSPQNAASSIARTLRLFERQLPVRARARRRRRRRAAARPVGRGARGRAGRRRRRR